MQRACLPSQKRPALGAQPVASAACLPRGAPGGGGRVCGRAAPGRTRPLGQRRRPRDAGGARAQGGDAAAAALGLAALDFWTNICLCQTLILEHDAAQDGAAAGAPAFQVRRAVGCPCSALLSLARAKRLRCGLAPCIAIACCQARMPCCSRVWKGLLRRKYQLEPS